MQYDLSILLRKFFLSYIYRVRYIFLVEKCFFNNIHYKSEKREFDVNRQMLS